MNRVEKATRYIADELIKCGYFISITTKSNWKEDKESNYTSSENRKLNWNTKEQMNRYLNNIKVCISQFAVSKEVENLPTSMDYLDYIGANNIEKNLVNIEFLKENMKSTYRYANTVYAGEGGLW